MSNVIDRKLFTMQRRVLGTLVDRYPTREATDPREADERDALLGLWHLCEWMEDELKERGKVTLKEARNG